MSVVWHKVWRDLAHNKIRTLLAVLSTAVGVFALGLVFGLSGVMRDRMTEDHRAAVPAHINLWGGPFDQGTVEAVLREPGVADVELEIWHAPLRWAFANSGSGETEWRDGGLYAREDYEAQRMDLIDLLDGHWPEKRTLAVERQSSLYFDVPLGATILVEFGHYERRVPVEGIVRMPLTFPPQFGGDAAFHATPETIAWLTGDESFNQGFDDLYVRLESFSQEKAEETAGRIKDRLERMGLSVGGPRITDPNVHWMQEQVDALLLILGILGGLSLGLSAFLIVNTMNALVAQQVWQIGVMKVVGATFGRIVRVYLTTALVYGVLASLIATPLGAIAAHLLAERLLEFFNIDVGPLQVAPAAVVIQLAVGLIVPLLAALAPVIGGARITAHQAISNYGLGAGFGRGWLDRLIGRVGCGRSSTAPLLPRPLAISLRNTFRRKARVALTLFTLTLGGAMFIVVMSVGTSLNHTIKVLLGDFGFDVLVSFDRSYHTARLVEVAESVPGVTRAEVWDTRGATLALANGEQRQTRLWGAPSDSELFDPRIVNGRCLLPGDGRAILLNNKIATDESIQVGEQITLTIGGRESVWTVVGLILNLNNNQSDNFVPLETLARETGNVNRGRLLMTTSEQQGVEGQQALIDSLRDTYAAHRIKASYFESAEEIQEQNRTQFNIITYLLLTMAILAAVVGSLGLMGTMSINVVERGREIGVMRSIGAASPAIAGIFVVEGMLVGVLSWLLAAPLSYPGALAFSQLVGNVLMKMPLDFSYSTASMTLWLGIVIVLSALASLWPALRATKVSVREALAYE